MTNKFPKTKHAFKKLKVLKIETYFLTLKSDLYLPITNEHYQLETFLFFENEIFLLVATKIGKKFLQNNFERNYL